METDRKELIKALACYGCYTKRDCAEIGEDFDINCSVCKERYINAEKFVERVIDNKQ